MRALIAVAVCIWPMATEAQTFSGNDLYAACNSSLPEQAGFCVGHITGLVQGFPFGASVVLFSLGTQSSGDANSSYEQISGYCLYQSVENGQIIQVVRTYMAEHPEKRHMPARWLILEAMQAAFPSSGGCAE